MSASVWHEERRNKKGRYYLLRWDVRKNGKSINRDSKAYFTKEALDIAMGEKRRDLKNPNVANGSIRFSEFKALFIARRERWQTESRHRKPLHPTTIQNSRRSVNKFAEFLKEDPYTHGDPYMNEIVENEEEFKELMNRYDIWLEKRGQVYNGRMIEMTRIKTAFTFAFKKKYIPKEADIIVPKQMPVGRELSDQELNLLFSKMTPLAKGALLYTLSLGKRRSETQSIRWEKIQRNPDGSWWVEIGGSSKDGQRFAPKAGSDRFLEIPPEVKELMGEPKESGPVFKISNSWLSHSISKAAKRALGPEKKDGIGRVRLHDLRHTFATRFLKEGRGSITDLQDIGGWKSINSLAKYLHLTKNRHSSHVGMFSPRTHPVPTKKMEVIDFTMQKV